jgi:hypothetical protein
MLHMDYEEEKVIEQRDPSCFASILISTAQEGPESGNNMESTELSY